MVFAMGVMDSFERSVNLGNPHLLGDIMPMVIGMVNSGRQRDRGVWDRFVGDLAEKV
jgi:hypothetical protein